MLCIGIFYVQNCNSQTPGQWVWKSGSNLLNYTGNYGIQGVADTSNKPPSLYEACEWSDLEQQFSG